ncbi:hypothetical protein ACFZCK_14185 [Kitasatospora purpeofusca]|uniref:hypothetical protein n=1 Tax=Kitasatospora purpeofusca TaxID=67352 RepID=UPI0036EA9975
MNPIVFGDAEAATIQYLKAHVPTPYSYSTDFPESESKTPHIVVRRYGGNYKQRAIDYARFSVEAWSTDRALAQDAIQEVIGWLHVANHKNYVSFDGIVLARVFVESAPQYFPDKTSGEHRWISTVAVYCRPKSA